MPTIGASIDRRSLRHLATLERRASTGALICSLCAEVRLCGAGRSSEIGRVSVGDMLDNMSERHFGKIGASRHTVLAMPLKDPWWVRMQ